MARAGSSAGEDDDSVSLLLPQQQQPPPSEEAGPHANANGGVEEPSPARPAVVKAAAVDRLGAEVTAIVTPVSICMLLVVVLVRFLQLQHDDDTNSQTAPSVADLYYQEQAGVSICF